MVIVCAARWLYHPPETGPAPASFFAAVCRKGNGIWKDSKVKWGFSFRLTPVSYGDDKATRDNVKLGVAALPILSVLYRRTMRGQCGGLIHPPGALASVPQQSPGGKKKKGPSPLPLRVGDAQGHDGGRGGLNKIYIYVYRKKKKSIRETAEEITGRAKSRSHIPET